MKFALKKWKPSFAVSMAANADNRNVSRYLRNKFPYPYTLRDAERYIDFCMRSEGKIGVNRAIVVDNKAVGSIGVSFQTDIHEKCAEIGYWIGEKYWGQGIVTEAVKELCDMIFKKYGIVRIYAEVIENNRPSAKVLEKAGFTKEGIMYKSICKNGNLYNSCIYALIKE